MNFTDADAFYNKMVRVYNESADEMAGYKKIKSIRDDLETDENSFKSGSTVWGIKEIVTTAINRIEDEDRKDKELKKVDKYVDRILHEAIQMITVFETFKQTETFEDRNIDIYSELEEKLKSKFNILSELIIDPFGNEKTLAKLASETCIDRKKNLIAYTNAGFNKIIIEEYILPEIVSNNYPQKLEYRNNKRKQLKPEERNPLDVNGKKSPLKLSSNEKPHKDEIYNIYGSLKKSLGVKKAFEELCNRIESMGYETSDYFRTDTPENFNKSYNNWKTKENKKSTSRN